MSTDSTVSPLRQRMIEDMAARKLGRHSQRSHISSCKRFAAFLKRSPDTATADDIRRFQLYLAESGISICNRNRIMTGVRFQFRVTLQASRSELAYIPFDIPSRQNCSRRGPTFVLSKPFSDIPSRRRRHAIRALPRVGSRPSIVHSNISALSIVG